MWTRRILTCRIQMWEQRVGPAVKHKVPRTEREESCVHVDVNDMEFSYQGNVGPTPYWRHVMPLRTIYRLKHYCISTIRFLCVTFSMKFVLTILTPYLIFILSTAKVEQIHFNIHCDKSKINES